MPRKGFETPKSPSLRWGFGTTDRTGGADFLPHYHAARKENPKLFGRSNATGVRTRGMFKGNDDGEFGFSFRT